MSRSLLCVLAATFCLSAPALADDSKSDATEKEAADYERATDCEWSRLSDEELSLMCFADPSSGGPSPLFVVTCADGTTFTYLGAAPGTGCSSAVGTNDCRAHQGCTSVQ